MPQPGDYGVTATNSWVSAAIRWCCKSKVNHAFVVLDGGNIIEAQPNGARVRTVDEYPDAIYSRAPLTDKQRASIVAYAKAEIGCRYNFLDIAAQLLVRVFGWHAPKFVLNRLADPERLQCAQLVDWVYEESGIQLFPDGRPEGLVAPSDLLNLIQEG